MTAEGTMPDPNPRKPRPNRGGGVAKDDRDPAKRCTARSSATGEPCGNWRAPGAVVCKRHGGLAPQVIRKAQLRLLEAADPIMGELVRIATDPNRDDDRKLRAITDALNRVPGLSSREGVDVSVFGVEATDDDKLTPFEKLVKGMTFGTVRRGARDPNRPPAPLPDFGPDEEEEESDARAEPRPSATPPRARESVALSPDDDPNVVEAELIEEPDPVPTPRVPATRPTDPFFGYADAELYRERSSEFNPDRPTRTPRPPIRPVGPPRRRPRR